MEANVAQDNNGNAIQISTNEALQFEHNYQLVTVYKVCMLCICTSEKIIHMSLPCTYICYFGVPLLVVVTCVPVISFTVTCVIYFALRKKIFKRKVRENKDGNSETILEDNYVPMSKIYVNRPKPQVAERKFKYERPITKENGNIYAPLTVVRIQTAHKEISKEVYYEVMRGSL